VTLEPLASLGGLGPRIVDLLRDHLATIRTAYAAAAASWASGLIVPEAPAARAITYGEPSQLPPAGQSWITVEAQLDEMTPTASGTYSTSTYTVVVAAYYRGQVYRKPDPSSSATDPDKTIQTSGLLAAQTLAVIAAQTLVSAAVPGIDGVYTCFQKRTTQARTNTRDVFGCKVILEINQQTSTGYQELP
jgi:hypothetical protein